MLKNSSQAASLQRITRLFFHYLNFRCLVNVYFMRTSSALSTYQSQVRRLFSTTIFGIITSIKDNLYTLSTIPTIRTIKLNILLILGGVYS